MPKASDSDSLKGSLVIAMPSLVDSLFAHCVCYLCQHDDQGAIGLLINQPIAMDVADLFSDQGLSVNKTVFHRPLLIGGPLQRERGFVLHTQRGHWRSSLAIQDDIYITTSQDILQAIADQKPPQQYLIVLGYSAWSPGQLEHEIQQNMWLTAPASVELLFETRYELRWQKAIESLGFTPAMLSKETGHA